MFDKKTPIDFQQVFELMPIACALLDHRVIVDCNELFARMWSARKQEIVGLTFSVLYAAESDFDTRGTKVGPLLAEYGNYTDCWLMKRLNGERFWCQVYGQTFDRGAPYARAVWTFADLSATQENASGIPASLTPREREVATLLLDGMSSKDIGRQLGLSPRTVHIHRASLLRKYAVKNTAELCTRLLSS